MYFVNLTVLDQYKTHNIVKDDIRPLQYLIYIFDRIDQHEIHVCYFSIDNLYERFRLHIKLI